MARCRILLVHLHVLDHNHDHDCLGEAGGGAYHRIGGRADILHREPVPHGLDPDPLATVETEIAAAQ